MATKKSTKKSSKMSTSRTASKKPSKRARSRTPPAAAKKRAAAKTRKASTHQMVHWEIQSQQPGRLHKFYADAFGWKVDTNNPMQYGMVSSGGPDGIDGGIGGSEATGSRVVVYVSVPSIDAILERITSLGGKTVMPRTDAGPVIMALYEDPEGNTMGLVEG